MSVNASFVALVCLQLSLVFCLYEDHKKPTYLEARVGSYVVFDCKLSIVLFSLGSIVRTIKKKMIAGPLEFPNDYPIAYHLFWRKDVSNLF